MPQRPAASGRSAPARTANDRLADYIEVPERIAAFKVKYPEGSLQTIDWQIVEVRDKTFIVYHAAAYRTEGDLRPGHGIAWEPFPGPSSFTRDSELMNAETSAWGRACVAVGVVASRKLASREEVENRMAGQSEPVGAPAEGCTNETEAPVEPPVPGDEAEVPGAEGETPVEQSGPITAEQTKRLNAALKGLPGANPKERNRTVRIAMQEVGVEGALTDDLKKLGERLTEEQADWLILKLERIVELGPAPEGAKEATDAAA